MALSNVAPHKFKHLDALRGLAAIIVIFRHAPEFFGGRGYFAHGYLAVDFFFILSGFVLSHAYQDRLDRGESFFKMLALRAIRLYPLYILALFIGSLRLLLPSGTGASHIGIGTLSELVVAALLFIPAPANGYSNRNFPLDHPTWSLLAEMVVNIAHFLVGRRRSLGVLLGVFFMAAAAEIITFHSKASIDLGFLRGEIHFALIRVCCSYTQGMVLYRLWHRFRGRLSFAFYWAPCLLLLTLGVHVPVKATIVFDLVASLVLLPLVVAFGALSNKLPKHTEAVANALGVSSYGLYVLHVPIKDFIFQVYNLHHSNLFPNLPLWAGLILLATFIALVCGLDRVYDLPVRRSLTRLLNSQRSNNSSRSQS